ncbi:MAG: hypothetical protein WCQ32_03350 [bacterium]
MNIFRIKTAYKTVVDTIQKSPFISSLLVFTFFATCFSVMYMTIPELSSGDDHYFHFRFASQLLDNGFWHSFRSFKTIYFSGIARGDHFLYYNFLFYAVLIPFTYITPLYIGIKFYAVCILALIGTIFYVVFRKMHILYPFLWALGFFVVLGFGSFYRIFLSRPFVFSPVILVLFTIALHKRKYFWIFVCAFLPLFWHTATFFVPVLIAIVYLFAYFFYYKVFPWKEFLYAILGTSTAIVLTLCIDKGFFISIKENLFDVLAGVLHTSANKPNISVGNEVYPKNFFDFINQNVLLSSIFIFSVVCYVRIFWSNIKNRFSFDNKKKDLEVLLLVLFAVSCVFITAIPLMSNRFTDVFIFFSWVFIVLVLSNVYALFSPTNSSIKNIVRSALVVFLLYFFCNSLLQLYDSFATSGSRPEQFSAIGGYLNDNLKKGDIVFDMDWSWFSQLYYYAPHQDYVIGLEPMLTYKYDPRLYWLWQNIGRGYVCDTENCPTTVQAQSKAFGNKKLRDAWVLDQGNSIADTISTDFKSNYIVSASMYSNLNYVLDNNKRFTKVITTDDTYFLYRINLSHK